MQSKFKLKDGCKFYPYDGGQGKEEFIICTPDKRQFKISVLSKEILQRLDGTRSLEELVRELEAEAISISSADLNSFLEQQYGKLSIFEDSSSHLDNHLGERQPDKVRLPFLFHWNLIHERHVAWLATRLRFLYHVAAVIINLTLIAITHYLVYFYHTPSIPVSNAGSLWVLILCLLSILCHEFGHAAAVAKYGGSPGHIGFGLYLLLPSFYADVSEVWRFRRRQRIVVDLGGLYFQEISFVVFALWGFYTNAPEFFAVCYFIDVMAWFNLNPIFRFDGYWLLVDYLALPNLYRQASKFIGYQAKRALGRSPAPMILPPMRRHIYWVFVIYAISCNLFLLFALWASYHYLSATFARLPRIFPEIFSSMLLAFKTHDIALFLNRLISLFFAIAFPGTALIGLYKYTRLTVRYCLAKIHRYRLS